VSQSSPPQYHSKAGYGAGKGNKWRIRVTLAFAKATDGQAKTAFRAVFGLSRSMVAKLR